MSDREIRAGIRGLFNYSPELIVENLGVDGANKLYKLALEVKNFAAHQAGNCRHCFPRIFKHEKESEDSNYRIINGAVISSSCSRTKYGGPIHDWCSNRDWTECSCSCECHCFVKNWKKENND